ncbi:hypothetical protein DPF_2258 [Desulfoplanes formicivorans]|uniref:Uncharacterized protein n=2 Tax=Desulfoplanes formicivorans TaxID=1592317 RepID=A0A194AKE9_9BACT|nr:hypothetical protein DPF_2258 [Desulfoplanes formicivorans]
MLNPGYHGSFACTVLERLESHFEGFVNRVERFQIEDLTASMIWSRYGRKMALAEVCTRFVPDPGDTHGACLFRYDKACILRCPVCPGRCSRYKLVSNDLERGEPFRQ